jgi:hypothetical protein
MPISTTAVRTIPVTDVRPGDLVDTSNATATGPIIRVGAVASASGLVYLVQRDPIAPLTHDVRLSDGIGWRTVLAVTPDTVTVNGRVEDETYPRAMVVDAYRRAHPAR